MTPTEKKYNNLVGKLYWSKGRNSLVIVQSVSKNFSRWRFVVQYLGKDIQHHIRTRDAIEIFNLVKKNNWIPATEYIKNLDTQPNPAIINP